MELYLLSKMDLSVISILKLSDYEINLDEETNSKSKFVVVKTDGLKKGNFLILNGLHQQFLFVIEDAEAEKSSNISTITALDISNIFDRKVIEKDIEIMSNESIEKFIATTISNNFVNSDDTVLNVNYIDIYWHTNTKGTVETNSENGLYNFHTFLTNCRQYKNIYTDFKIENGRLKIDIRNRNEAVELIDTTLPEVTEYNNVYDTDITAKVTVYAREDGSEYNLYLKTDRTTTTNKNDANRANGKIEVISVDTADKAPEEALNVMKGNTYNHLVEFKISRNSKLMNIKNLYIGRPVRIKTEDSIYDSYISAITIKDENFIYYKSGNLRVTLLDKLKQTKNNSLGNKLDLSGVENSLTSDSQIKALSAKQGKELNNKFSNLANKIDSSSYDMFKASAENVSNTYCLMAEYTLTDWYSDISDIIMINSNNINNLENGTIINVLLRKNQTDLGLSKIKYLTNTNTGLEFYLVVNYISGTDTYNVKLYCKNVLTYTNVYGKSLDYKSNKAFNTRTYYIDQPNINALPSGTIVKAVGQELYSTDETMIGQWIDGKPLYRKVVTYNSIFQNNSWNDIAFSVLGLNNISTLLIKDGFVVPQEDNTIREMIYNSGNRIQILYSRNAIGVYINTGTITSITLVLEYTKTTD